MSPLRPLHVALGLALLGACAGPAPPATHAESEVAPARPHAGSDGEAAGGKGPTETTAAAPEPGADPAAAATADASSRPTAEVAGASSADPLAYQRRPPEGFVDLREVIPGARFDIRYHTADNFTGAPLPGYGAPGAWLLAEVADPLAAVHAALADEGYGLVIYDAYRPNRASRAMVAWAERSGQPHLLDGYIARYSNHNRGNTVDLGLFDLQTGELVEMGTEFDTLEETAHTRNATGEVLAHRLLLQEAMKARGFEPYWREWWHFTYPSSPRPPIRDAPYSCFEADEGAWTEPEGWAGPDFEVPTTWTPTRCPPDPPREQPPPQSSAP